TAAVALDRQCRDRDAPGAEFYAGLAERRADQPNALRKERGPQRAPKHARRRRVAQLAVVLLGPDLTRDVLVGPGAAADLQGLGIAVEVRAMRMHDPGAQEACQQPFAEAARRA